MRARGVLVLLLVLPWQLAPQPDEGGPRWACVQLERHVQAVLQAHPRLVDVAERWFCHANGLVRLERRQGWEQEGQRLPGGSTDVEWMGPGL